MTALNLPTPEGIALGFELARLTEATLAELSGLIPERCQSCAFRAGTIPNGCPPTLAQAVESIRTGEPFYCHEQPIPCAGWVIAMRPLMQP